MDTISFVQEPLIIEIWQGDDWTTVSAGSSDTFDGGISFLSLSDTPDTYKNQAGKTPVVNDDEDGLTFKNIVPAKFTGLSDCPPSYKNAANKLVRVKKDAKGLEFVNIAQGEMEDFIQLADVPSSYEGYGGYVVSVLDGENGLDFVTGESTLPEHFDDSVEYTYPRLTINKYGIITDIESQEPGTILPNFENNKLLYGNGTNIPVSLPNGAEGSVLTASIATQAPSFSFLNTLRSSAGRIQLTIEEDPDTNTYLYIHQTPSDIDLYSASIIPESNINLNLYAQRKGIINLGNILNQVNLNCDMAIAGQLVAAVDEFVFVPKGYGTIRVDPINTSTYSYTNNVLNENDLTNKGYVDKAIAEAIAGTTRTLSISAPINITVDTGTTIIADNVTGKILDEIKILVNVNFNEEFYLMIGDDYDNDYLSDGPIYLNGGSYLITIPCLATIVRDTLKVFFINSGNATEGNATMIVKWI